MIALMEKFEIILFLDERRLLVPSLLPPDESKSCPIFSGAISAKLSEEDSLLLDYTPHTPHTPLCQTPHPFLVRYYLLPFVPNGFIARLTARLMSTDMIDYIQNSLVSGPLDDRLSNQAHWKCWRDGIVITWHHMEIFRIAPVTFPLLGTTETHLISSEGDRPVKTSKGIEIKVAILPEEINIKSNFFPNERSNLSTSTNCRAAWLLHQATTIVNSVFEDWYEVFAKDKSIDYDNLTANPCTECSEFVCKLEREALTTTLKDQQVGPGCDPSTASPHPHSSNSVHYIFYMFTSPYCCRAVADGNLDLNCPIHGKLDLNTVAPDLVFRDFPPSMVTTDPDRLIMGQSLGDGGYGSVFKAGLKQVISSYFNNFSTD